jgi:hypothetical protein
VLASKFFTATGAARDAIFKEASVLAAEVGPAATHYLRVMEKVINGTENYIAKESKRYVVIYLVTQIPFSSSFRPHSTASHLSYKSEFWHLQSLMRSRSRRTSLQHLPQRRWRKQGIRLSVRLRICNVTLCMLTQFIVIFEPRVGTPFIPAGGSGAPPRIQRGYREGGAPPRYNRHKMAALGGWR